jgi:hypothetical protein
MAEKITIFEIDIDVEASKNDIEELRLSVNELKKGLKELTDEEKKVNKELDEQKNKLKELQNAKKQDIKAIAETQKNITNLLNKRNDLNKSIVDQSTVLKVNQTQLRQNQKVIQDSIIASNGWNQELEEEKIKLQLLNSERRKTIREGIKLANEKKELTRLQNTQNKSQAELIRLNSLLVKQRKNLRVTNRSTRKEYNQLTKSIAKTNRELLKQDRAIGRNQRNVGNYTNALRGLVAGLGITGGIAGITQFLSRSTDAYQDQILVVEKLTTVLRQRTNATDIEIQSILDLTTAQQRQGIIGDEIQIAGAQQIATFVTQTDSIKTLIPALNDLLAQQKGVNATQQDAVGIGNLIGKVLQGETTALKRVGVTFNSTQEQILKFGNESERSATLAQVITDNVGDMNEALAETDAGQLKNVENNLGDIEEQIGEAILPALTEWKQLQLEILEGLQSLSAGYDVVAFEIAKANAQRFIDENKLKTEAEKTLAIQRRFLQIESELLKVRKERADLSSSASVEEKKTLRERESALDKEKIFLIEIGKQGFLNTQFKEKEVSVNKEVQKSEEQLERERARAAREREKRRKEEERQKERDAKAESERKKKAAQDAIDEFNRLRDLERQKREFVKNAREELIEQEKERQIVDQENELALLEGSILGELEAERRGLEIKRQQEIEFAEKIGADTTLIEAKYAKAREELNEAETSAKLSLAEDFFNNVATIAGKGTAVGKAAAVAATTISTYQAATGSFAALSGIPVVGPILGAVAAAAAVAAGIANVRKILAVKTGLPGDTGAGGGTTPTASSAPTISTPRPGAIAPEVGQGIIARGIPFNNNQQAAPQTAVVVDEVTAKQTQQESNSNTSVI